MVTDAQRRANQKQDAARKRAALWLDPADAKALERIMRQNKLPSRIAALRWLVGVCAAQKNAPAALVALAGYRSN